VEKVEGKGWDERNEHIIFQQILGVWLVSLVPPLIRKDIKTAVGRAFQPDSEPGNVRLESLTYLIFWRWLIYFG